MRTWSWVLFATCLGCGPSSMEPDAGSRPDAGADAGSRDAGSADAGTADAGSDAAVLADAGAGDAGPPPPPIDWDWEWVNRRPHGNSLYGVDMSSATDGWA